MPGHKSKPPVSRAQAHFFGAIIGGEVHAPGMSVADAKKKLKGVKLEDLPDESKKKKKKKG